MKHQRLCDQHTWVAVNCVLLELPDANNFADRSMYWRCKYCEADCCITGHIKIGYPVRDPGFWMAVEKGHIVGEVV